MHSFFSRVAARIRNGEPMSVSWNPPDVDDADAEQIQHDPDEGDVHVAIMEAIEDSDIYE